MPNPIITPTHIRNACDIIRRNPTAYMPNRPLPTTPGRRATAILAAGRDALANLLIRDVPYVTWSNITRAIRAGHQGSTTDFAAINRSGAIALGIISE